jgi:hypothetical protein
MLLKHAIKSVYFVFTSEAYVAVTYQLCFRDVSNEKRGAIKADHVERKREKEEEEEERERDMPAKKDERQMRDFGNKRKIICVHLNLVFSIYLPQSSITFNSF